MGRAQLEGVKSSIRLILLHIAKTVSQPDAPSVGHWRTESIGWQADLSSAFAPSMRQRIDMDGLWRVALKQAASALEEYRAGLTGPCPVGLDDLLSDRFEFREVVARVSQQSA